MVESIMGITEILEKDSWHTENEVKHNVDWEKIKRDIARVRHQLNFEVDPRKHLHLDKTKVAFHKERVDAWLRGEKIAPITIDMALTQKCQYACTYCYAGLQYNPASPTTWDVYANFLDDCVSIGHKPGEGVKAVSLISDGESSLNRFYYDFVRKAKQNGIHMGQATNGLALEKGKLEQLLSDMTYIRFNISAGEPEPYAKIMGTTVENYHKVIAIIKDCVEIKRRNKLDVTIGLQMVLLPECADQIIPLAILGRDLGVDYTIIKHCSDDESGRLGVDYNWYKRPEALGLLKIAEAMSTEEYSVQAKWSKIKTGRDRRYSKCFGTPFLLQMSGTCLVAPCGMLFNKSYEEFHIGNYAEKRFKDIWASDRYWEVMGYLGSDKFDPRKRCGTLCIQDKVNEAIFDLVEQGIPLEDVTSQAQPMHANFI